MSTDLIFTSHGKCGKKWPCQVIPWFHISKKSVFKDQSLFPKIATIMAIERLLAGLRAPLPPIGALKTSAQGCWLLQIFYCLSLHFFPFFVFPLMRFLSLSFLPLPLSRAFIISENDSGYPRDAGDISFKMANPGSSLRFDTHWSAPPVSALARSGRPRKMPQAPVSRNSNIQGHPGHRNHVLDPASEFLSTHWWSQQPACQRCFYKPLRNCQPSQRVSTPPVETRIL